jgi:hypothetical protein
MKSPCQSFQVSILLFTKDAPMFLKYDPYRVWCSIFYSKLVNCMLFKIIVQHVRFVKGRGGHVVVGKETFLIDFRKSLRFSLTSSLSQLTEKSSRSVFTMCGEPCKSIKFGLKGTFFLKRDYFRICSKSWLVNLVVWHLISLLSLKCCKWKIPNPKGKNWTF